MLQPINNICFNGRFRYLGAIPANIEEVEFFEIGERRVTKQLLEFSEKSKFLNKLKEDKDVMLFHHRKFAKQEPEKQGLFSKTFSVTINEPKHKPEKIGDDYLSVIFANNKPANPKDTEFCAIQMSMPLNKNAPDNLDRFEKVLKNNSDVNLLKTIADKLFPNDNHKVIPLPNSEKGFCEFWTGTRYVSDTLDKLYAISRAQIQNIYKRINQNILKKTFG